MGADSITVSLDDLISKVEELKADDVNYVRLSIVGDSYDSELSFEAYTDDGYPVKFGNIPASEYQE